jgi:hypothetical protein
LLAGIAMGCNSLAPNHLGIQLSRPAHPLSVGGGRRPREHTKDLRRGIRPVSQPERPSSHGVDQHLHGPEPAPARRRRQRRPRVALVTGAAGVLALGALGIGDLVVQATAGTSGSHPREALATSSSAGTAPRYGRPRRLGGPLGPAGGLWRLGSLGGPPALGGVGTVTAVSASTVTIRTAAGATRTIDTNSATRYYTMLTPSPRSALRAGDRVAVLGRPAARPMAGPSSARSAAVVVVLEPYAIGTVVSATLSRIVVRDAGGLERYVLVGTTTAYEEAGTAVSRSALAPGEEILAYGHAAADPTELSASHVVVVGPRVAGIVTAVSGRDLDLRTVSGTVIVTTRASTLVRKLAAASSLSSMRAGDLVVAIGRSEGSQRFAATAVVVATPPAGRTAPAGSLAPGGSGASPSSAVPLPPARGPAGVAGLGAGEGSSLAGLLNELLAGM